MSQPFEMIRRYIVKVPDPAAGADFTIKPNRLGDWLVRKLVLTLATSATVATRAMVIKATDGSDTYFLTASDTTQAASLTQQFTAFEGNANFTGAGTVFSIGWPTHGLYLPQGYTLQSQIGNIQAADQISSVRLWVEEYPTGPDTSWQNVSNAQITERGTPNGVSVVQY